MTNGPTTVAAVLLTLAIFVLYRVAKRHMAKPAHGSYRVIEVHDPNDSTRKLYYAQIFRVAGHIDFDLEEWLCIRLFANGTECQDEAFKRPAEYADRSRKAALNRIERHKKYLASAPVRAAAALETFGN